MFGSQRFYNVISRSQLGGKYYYTHKLMQYRNGVEILVTISIHMYILHQVVHNNNHYIKIYIHLLYIYIFLYTVQMTS